MLISIANKEVNTRVTAPCNVTRGSIDQRTDTAATPSSAQSILLARTITAILSSRPSTRTRVIAYTTAHAIRITGEPLVTSDGLLPPINSVRKASVERINTHTV